MSNDIDQVESVAEEVLEEVHVVGVEGVDCILDQKGALLLAILKVQGAPSKVLGDLAQFTVLEGLPDPMGEVEQHTLKMVERVTFRIMRFVSSFVQKALLPEKIGRTVPTDSRHEWSFHHPLDGG